MKDTWKDIVEWANEFRGAELPIDRLAAALYVGGRSSPRVRLMAMFSAYFDASGDENKPFVVVAGYIANYLQWRALESAWEHIHQSHDVNPPFHAAEFEAALKNEKYKDQRNARQDYVALATDRAKAMDFIQQICIAQMAMAHMGISCIVRMDVYNEVNKKLNFREALPPYALGARVCITWIRWWQRAFDIQDPVETIFEDGDFGQGAFTDLMVAGGMEKPIYKKKSDFAGLQAADHYAWEQFYRLKQEERDKNIPFRETFGSQLNAIPKRHMEPTADGLVKIFGPNAFDAFNSGDIK